MTKTQLFTLATLLTASPAFGFTLTYSGTFNNNPGAYPRAFNSSVPQFDPVLGTLTSVSLSITSDSSARVEYENEAASGGSATANLIGIVSGSFSGLSTTVGLSDSDAVTIGIDDEPGIPDFTGVDYHDYGLLLDTGSDSDLKTSGLGAYIGVGTITLNVTDNQGWSVSGVGDGVTRVTLSRSSTDWTITYTYVPEPGSAVMALGAMLGMALRRRR